MKNKLTYISFFLYWTISGQIIDTLNHSSFITPEFMIGQLSEPNTDFPDVGTQKSFYLNFGSFHNAEDQEWVYRLNYPKTGLLFGISDYSNAEFVGKSYSFIPNTEFNFLKSKRFNLLFGLGISYHNVKYNIRTNPLNKGISTEIAWAFRGSLLYELWKLENATFKLGLNYLHHSNGHVKLPNQGYNSFLLGLSYEIEYSNGDGFPKVYLKKVPTGRSLHNFYSFRFGLGQNVLSEIFNDKKEIYSAAFTYGKVINKTYKFGIGVNYRFYGHYYDYIKNEEELIVERYPQFIENPFGYATNFGVFGTGELLMNHFGVEFQLGLNIYKPFYQVDWILNQGYVFIATDEEQNPFIAVVYGELDWYYEIKRTVSSRLGLKYYLVGTDKNPKHNFYVGAHINANLGQADFNELSFGYVYSFNFREKGYSPEK